MAKVDIEFVLSEIETYLKAHLSAKLTEIDSDKSDGITLKPVDAAAYCLQSLNDKVMGFDPYILYGIDHVDGEGQGPYTRKRYSLMVILVLADQGSDTSVVKRLLRYSRALTEVFEGGWDKICDGVKLEVESLAPVQFRLVNSSEDFRAVGVSIAVTLG